MNRLPGWAKTVWGWVVPVLGFVAIVVIWDVIGFRAFRLAGAYKKPDLTRTGAFGSAFGFDGSLFAALAFAGVAYSILLQRQEIRDTKEELRQAADAREQTIEALKRQSDALLLAAKINVLAAIANANALLAEATRNRGTSDQKQAEADARKRIRQLRQILARLNKDGESPSPGSLA